VNIPVYRPNAAEALEVCIDMGVRVVYTSAGSPAKFMDTIKRAGLKVIHKVSSVDMARKAQSAGVDAVVAMGFEAGGHIGREGVTTFCLIPALVRAVDIPVIASGGIGDGGGLLVATAECPVPAFFKDAVVQSASNATVVLGREAMPIRVLRNMVTSTVAGMGDAEADRAMAAQGDARYVADGGSKDTAVMPCGQVAGLLSGVVPVDELLSGMISGARSVLENLGSIYAAGHELRARHLYIQTMLRHSLIGEA
jgi:enoyl-[acyl-carrier protein] reductase II